MLSNECFRAARCQPAASPPARGLDGWRLTHAQAEAAYAVALRRPRELTRYAEVALVAALLRDELLAKSLRAIYLAPLGDEQGGAALRATLREYFAAGRRATTTAERLGVARQTIENRLRSAEQAIGRSLRSCSTDLELALCLRN